MGCHQLTNRRHLLKCLPAFHHRHLHQALFNIRDPIIVIIRIIDIRDFISIVVTTIIWPLVVSILTWRRLNTEVGVNRDRSSRFSILSLMDSI